MLAPLTVKALKALGSCFRRGALVLALLLLTIRAFAGQVTLGWDPSPSAGVAGYMLYYGQSKGIYNAKIDVGNVTTYTITNLTEGATYYYAATSYDAARAESSLSNEVSNSVPPTANFSANATSGKAPLAVTFTSTSTGAIGAYLWTFGDGPTSTSTAQNPSHTYATAGVYSVTLKVTGTNGTSAQTTKSSYITVSAPTAAPVAGFNANKTSGAAPLTVNFTSTSTGAIGAYLWTFGDGPTSTSTAQNPSHTYATAGVYSVTLKVTGTNGTSAQTTKSSYITVSAPTAAPVAGFNANKTSGAAPLAVNFTSTSTGAIGAYLWTFGDGPTSTSTAQNPSHTYATAGVYSVTLKVTGTNGTSAQTTKSSYITVSAPTAAPVAGFNANKTSGAAPLAVNFTSTSTGAIGAYLWTFGDGPTSTSTAQNPSHTYATAGVYSVTLKVTGTNGTSAQTTKSSYITVSAPTAAPVAGFNANKTSGAAPLAVNFTSTSTGAIGAYLWTFGDGPTSTSTAQNPSHTYATAGVYSVTLKVTGTNGTSAQTTKSNYITVSAPTAAPVAGFNANKTSGAAPLAVNFTSTSTGAIGAYLWTFGDGPTSTSTAQNPSHTYATAGVYSVTLKVTGTNGTSAQTTKSNYITVSAPPTQSSYTLWAATAKPVLADDPDGKSVNLGVKFTSSQNGYISGIRFYKSAANTGTHIATLWTSTGQKLAQATFTNETASGWQQVNFSTPVPITANTVYVAAYLAPKGHYANDDKYFTTAGVDNGPLRALRNGASGPNGLYAYSSGPAFPNTGYQETNYWVDVVFKLTK